MNNSINQNRILDLKRTIITMSKDTLYKYSKTTILKRCESFFGYKYHSQHSNWNTRDYRQIYIGDNNQLTGTNKTKRYHPNFKYLDFNDILDYKFEVTLELKKRLLSDEVVDVFDTQRI